MIHKFFRQCCSIASAARQNPDRQVFVLFVTPVGFAKNETAPPALINIVLKYPNVHLRNVNLSRFIDDPLISDWVFKDRRIFKANYPILQVSDFLRLVGMIMIRSDDSLHFKVNFIF